MMAFASLFLGLVLGIRPVEIVLGQEALPGRGDEVASILLLLDGETVAERTQPPWRADVDFGTELQPHHLEAIALDREGGELGRIEQWLNLPQAPAVVDAVLETAPEGSSAGWIARLTWESSVGAEPESVKATLDGVALAVPDPSRIPIPDVDPAAFHLLHVEMRFEDRVTTSLDLTFGGAYMDRVSTEMTAIPLVRKGKAGRRSGSLTVDDVAEWFSARGEALRVVALERERKEIVFVMDRPFAHFFLPDERPKIPKSLDLDEDHRIRFVSSVPSQKQGVASTFELFPLSKGYGQEVGTLYRLLTGISRPPGGGAARPAAAVAVAGLAAYESRGRRAVVLVPSERPSDDELDPARVRAYLRALHVPLAVWEPESRPSGRFGAWGEVRSTGTMKQLAAAFEELEEELDRQWVVWIDGQHLPQEIELSAEVEDWELLR